ncbi:MAG: hypothetical protein ACI4ES_08075 [Roseburia sp.]
MGIKKAIKVIFGASFLGCTILIALFACANDFFYENRIFLEKLLKILCGIFFGSGFILICVKHIEKKQK